MMLMFMYEPPFNSTRKTLSKQFLVVSMHFNDCNFNHQLYIKHVLSYCNTDHWKKERFIILRSISCNCCKLITSCILIMFYVLITLTTDLHDHVLCWMTYSYSMAAEAIYTCTWYGPKDSCLTYKSRSKWKMLWGIYSAIYGEVKYQLRSALK